MNTSGLQPDRRHRREGGRCRTTTAVAPICHGRPYHSANTLHSGHTKSRKNVLPPTFTRNCCIGGGGTRVGEHAEHPELGVAPTRVVVRAALAQEALHDREATIRSRIEADDAARKRSNVVTRVAVRRRARCRAGATTAASSRRTVSARSSCTARRLDARHRRRQTRRSGVLTPRTSTRWLRCTVSSNPSSGTYRECHRRPADECDATASRRRPARRRAARLVPRSRGAGGDV